jgi:hypothetical protein
MTIPTKLVGSSPKLGKAQRVVPPGVRTLGSSTEHKAGFPRGKPRAARYRLRAHRPKTKRRAGSTTKKPERALRPSNMR